MLVPNNRSILDSDPPPPLWLKVALVAGLIVMLAAIAWARWG